jgi:hypothetical protein
MKQIHLLKKLLATPGIYATPQQRQQARANLLDKMKMRDYKLQKKTQTKLEL